MAGKSSVIDQAVIRDLAAILKETDLTEIEVEQGELRIRVSRAGASAAPAPRSTISRRRPLQTPLRHHLQPLRLELQAQPTACRLRWWARSISPLRRARSHSFKSAQR